MRTLGDNAVDGAANFRIAELRFGAEVLPFRGRKLAFGGFQGLLLPDVLQIGQLTLGDFVLRASLREGDLGRIQVATWKGALIEEFFATVEYFLLSIKIGFRRSRVQFRFLNFLGKAGGCRSRVASFRLFEFTFALLRHGGEVCVFQHRKELAFFDAASALNEKLFNCGGNFR